LERAPLSFRSGHWDGAAAYDAVIENLLQLLTSVRGPPLPTWAVHEVGSYLGYTGRDADESLWQPVTP